MRLLVTGGAGFIGSHVVERAVADPRISSVVVLDDLSTGRAENLAGLEVETRIASILDRGALAEAVRGADAVVHLAGVSSVARSIADPVGCHAVNATGTLFLLEACRAAGVGHVAAASSSAVYGRNQQVPVAERDWVRPLSPYGVSKLATEQYLLAYADCFGLGAFAARLFNVYGPRQDADGDYAAVVARFAAAIAADRELTLHGDGGQTRDFVYVGTVAEVLLTAAMEGISAPEPVNVAFGAPTSLLQLIAALEDLTGRAARVSRAPARPGDVRHSAAEPGVLRGLMPALAPVELREGLAALLAAEPGESGAP